MCDTGIKRKVKEKQQPISYERLPTDPKPTID